MLIAADLAVFFDRIEFSSRSLMVWLSPPGQRTKLFGIYALAGRATAPLLPSRSAGRSSPAAASAPESCKRNEP